MATLTNNGICRCCASEGTFKDVRSVYVWMGEEEIYADMLKECFDITLSAQEGLSGVCEVCVTQLRNARNFKRQVLDIEDRFRRHLFDDLLNRECTPAPHSLLVKMEVQAEGHSESEPDDVDDEDYTPEFKEVPVIKREASEEPKAKRRAKTTAKKKEGVRHKDRAKKDIKESIYAKELRDWSVTVVKSEFIEIKDEIDDPFDIEPKRKKTRGESSSKKDMKDSSKLLRTRKIANATNITLFDNVTELEKHRHNIKVILESSNATPIRCRGGIGYACCFCTEQFPDAADLKAHTLTHEDKLKKNFMKKKMMYSFLVKLDITALVCKMCQLPIDTYDGLVDHLTKAHQKKFFTDIKNHIIPFKFTDDVLRCTLCPNVFNKFKMLQEHMNTHYRNYVCTACDAGFVNRHMLQSHTESHKLGSFACSICEKVFDTFRKKKSHEKSVHVHANFLNKCGYCKQKFKDYRKKDEHLIKVHGVKAMSLKCQACDKVFDNRSSLTTHTKRDHLLERRHKCPECDMKFFSSGELKEHKIKHSGQKEYRCEVCLKAYGRRKTLREHMRIHEDDRRFKCEHCGLSFVQKCSWRGHMRSKHGENL